MANRDQTGPDGKGARTGRGLGNCPATGVPDGNTTVVTPARRPVGGRGVGRGFGRGLPVRRRGR